VSQFKQALNAFLSDDEGASAVEYAILVAVIAVAVFAAVKVFNLNGIFTSVNSKVNGCVNGTGTTC
jgi:Flp pilus assembly pilin Flp